MAEAKSGTLTAIKKPTPFSIKPTVMLLEDLTATMSAFTLINMQLLTKELTFTENKTSRIKYPMYVKNFGKKIIQWQSITRIQ